MQRHPTAGGSAPPGVDAAASVGADCPVQHADRGSSDPPDAHYSNAIVTGHGPLLLDGESACLGPAAYDLTTLAVHCDRFAHPPGEYDAFAEAYGLDVRSLPGYGTFKEVRELRMITTNA
jgi:hypothetical protein